MDCISSIGFGGEGCNLIFFKLWRGGDIWKCGEHVVKMLWTCQEYLHEDSWTCCAVYMWWTSFTHLLNMCWTCHEHAMNMPWTCHEHVMNMSWSCYEHVMNMSWRRSKRRRHLPEILKFLWKDIHTDRQTLWFTGKLHFLELHILFRAL